MKPTFPLVEVAGLGELSASVRRSLVEPVQIALQQLRAFMSGGVDLGNLRAATVTLTMTHNTEKEIQSPFAPGMPLLWYPGKAIQSGTTARFIEGYKLNPFRTDGLLGLTCLFDANVTCEVTGVLWSG